MSLLSEICAAVTPVNDEAARHAQLLLDEKTKPRGSLGVLESLACRLAAIAGHVELEPTRRAVVVMAADHGVVEEGVSAYPAEVTEQMLVNFAGGGAAINVLARQAGADVVAVNMGTRTRREGEGETGRGGEREVGNSIRDASVGPGTANIACGPAMSQAQALQGLETGIQIAADLRAAGVGLIGVGEMGIGNTTAASALTAVFTGAPLRRVTGHGTGIDDIVWQHKVNVIERALAINKPSRDQPLDALAKVGGFELAGLAGLMLGAAAKKIPVLLDGFITGAAALVAVAICPAIRDYLIASHQSVEPGHRHILEHLGLRPLLNLDLRLGEGTGAALAMHLVEAAVRIVREMATFASAGVTNTGA
jgi:nicotinate-nucleotide--dimethylbenzimidazole phosphoribosyltransferase